MSRLTISISFCIFLTTCTLFAGNIYIHNTTTQAIKFRFIPQPQPEFNYQIAQQSTRHIEITSAQFDGKSIYAIEGETSFGGDSCFNLHTGHDYKIYFKKTKLGTVCQISEIKKRATRSGKSKTVDIKRAE